MAVGDSGPSSARPGSKHDPKDLLLHAQLDVAKPLPEEDVKLPVRDELFTLPENPEQCPCCEWCGGKDWKKLEGLTENSTEITIIERTLEKKRNCRQKYECGGCKKAGATTIISAPGPEKIAPGCEYAIDFGVAVVVNKFLNHLPLERQRKIMSVQGLTYIEVKTLWNLTRLIGDALSPIGPMILREILSDVYPAHLDETPWPILRKSSASDGYMWIISNRKGSYFVFEPSRSGAIASELLGDYEGTILTDGFSAYTALDKKADKKFRCAYCWAHVRRKFFELIENHPELIPIVELIDAMFATERGAKSLQELKRRRDLSSRIVIDQLHAWMMDTLAKPSTLPKGALAKAIKYALKLWKGLTLFVDRPEIPISNNAAERGVRQPVMGRNNFVGSRTIDGADLAAQFYTLIESCKLVSINPEVYLREMLRRKWRGEKLLTPLEFATEIRPPAQNPQSAVPA